MATARHEWPRGDKSVDMADIYEYQGALMAMRRVNARAWTRMLRDAETAEEDVLLFEGMDRAGSVLYATEAAKWMVNPAVPSRTFFHSGGHGDFDVATLTRTLGTHRMLVATTRDRQRRTATRRFLDTLGDTRRRGRGRDAVPSSSSPLAAAAAPLGNRLANLEMDLYIADEDLRRIRDEYTRMVASGTATAAELAAKKTELERAQDAYDDALAARDAAKGAPPGARAPVPVSPPPAAPAPAARAAPVPSVAPRATVMAPAIKEVKPTKPAIKPGESLSGFFSVANSLSNKVSRDSSIKWFCDTHLKYGTHLTDELYGHDTSLYSALKQCHLVDKAGEAFEKDFLRRAPPAWKAHAGAMVGQVRAYVKQAVRDGKKTVLSHVGSARESRSFKNTGRYSYKDLDEYPFRFFYDGALSGSKAMLLGYAYRMFKAISDASAVRKDLLSHTLYGVMQVCNGESWILPYTINPRMESIEMRYFVRAYLPERHLDWFKPYDLVAAKEGDSDERRRAINEELKERRDALFVEEHPIYQGQLMPHLPRIAKRTKKDVLTRIAVQFLSPFEYQRARSGRAGLIPHASEVTAYLATLYIATQSSSYVDMVSTSPFAVLAGLFAVGYSVYNMFSGVKEATKEPEYTGAKNLFKDARKKKPEEEKQKDSSPSPEPEPVPPTPPAPPGGDKGNTSGVPPSPPANTYNHKQGLNLQPHA